MNRIPGLPIQKKPFTLKNDPHIGMGTDACWDKLERGGLGEMGERGAKCDHYLERVFFKMSRINVNEENVLIQWTS